jgi:FkbM family methyltransferase
MKLVYSHFFDRGNNPKMYNGQFGEDKWILENIDVPEKGVVVDVGADQPIFGSNTYYFEKYLGWDSICIDADARTIEKLKTKRKNVVHAAVSDKDGTIKFHQHELAGISAVDSNGEVEVPCLTLNTILEKAGITEITLLDIDVEGHEPYVIRGLDWKKYDPQIVVIEYGSPAGGIIKDELMKFFNDLGGYQLVYTSPANLIYVKAV